MAGSRMIIVGLVAAVGWACNASPTKPTSWPRLAPSGEPVVRAVEIIGPQIVPPGESAQFSVIAHLTNGDRRDVTNEVQWSSGGGQVSVTQSGAVTGIAVGESWVQARFDEHRTVRVVTVLAAGTYKLMGTVYDPADPHAPIVGARVEITNGVGGPQVALTDGSSSYSLYGVSGAIGLRVAMRGYQTIERTIIVNNHGWHDIELAYISPE